MDHLAHLSAGAATVAEILRTGRLDAPVPRCPDWTLRALGLHLGGVHLWVSQIVRTGARQPLPEVAVADEELAGWYAGAAAALRTDLDIGEDRPAWTLSGPGTVGFWRRRQALETAVHRVDAELAVGRGTGIPADLAADGIAEVVDVLHPRQVRRGAAEEPTCSVRLVASEGGSWLLGSGVERATLSGPASDLLLLLWRRRGRSGLDARGDVEALDALLSQAITP